VPFWVNATVQGQSVCSVYSTLIAHPLAFYKNVEFLPPHTAVEESPTPPLSSDEGLLSVGIRVLAEH